MTINLYFIIKLLSCLIHAILSVYVLLKSPRQRLNRIFSLTVFSVFIGEFGYLMFFAGSGQALWIRIAMIGQCLAAANIILFTLIYGKENYRESLRAGKFYLILAYAVWLILTITILSDVVRFEFLDNSADEIDAILRSGYVLTFNRAGIFVFAFLFISALVALTNLENTYRQTRHIGRRITYPAVIFIGMLSFHLLIYSLALGFSYIRVDVLIAASITLILANLCIAYPVIRPKAVGPGIYVSRAVISRSYTLLLAGLYLLIIGMLGKIIQLIGRNLNFLLAFLVAFLVLLLLIIVILSKSLKQRFQLFIERNFYRSKYDYRREWENFSGRVFSTFSVKELLQEVLDVVSETIGTNGISIVSIDRISSGSSRLMFDGSRIRHLVFSSENREFLDWLWRYGKPVKVDEGKCFAADTSSRNPDIPGEILSILSDLNSSGAATSQSGAFVPIIAERKMMAMMILGGRETGPYSQEDLDLLETMANQFSIAIMNAQTSQELSLSRELESFYRLSSMLLHDLKSSASMLSLVIQNAADNFDNPEFQKDALGTMSNVVDRIQKLVLRLSAAPQKMEFQQNLQPVDLVQIAIGAMTRSNVRDLTRIEVVEELSPVSQIMADPENIERVILNIILNAIEAIKDKGMITVRTYEEKIQDAGTETGSLYGVISVTDTGCGMSDEFIRERLFQPFQTTKERGLGLGLYQCKAIIDACDGVIDAQSRQGSGTTFAVKLPAQVVRKG